MAIPGHEFLTAHFSNNERTIVESYWVTPDGKETRVEYIEANPEDTAWKKLLTHIDIDSLHENTYRHIREQNENFEDTVIELARSRGMIYNIDEISTDVHKIIAQTLLVIIFFKNEDKLFNLININILKLKKILVMLLIFFAIIILPFLPFNNLKILKYTMEWNYFIGVNSFYLLSFFMWKKLNHNPSTT